VLEDEAGAAAGSLRLGSFVPNALVEERNDAQQRLHLRNREAIPKSALREESDERTKSEGDLVVLEVDERRAVAGNFATNEKVVPRRDMEMAANPALLADG